MTTFKQTLFTAATASNMTTAEITSVVLPPTKLAHVVLKTSNFASMVSWYKAALGAHATYENPGMAFLTYDREHHRIAIANLPDCRSPDNPMQASGLEHIAFTYATLRDMVTSYKQRKARHILPVWSVNHGTTTSMYYQDPDGNKIEVQVDAFQNVEDANAYFRSPAFAENPIGVDFDPEELVRRVEDGEDENELLRRPNIGPRGIDSVPTPPKPDVRQTYELLQADI